MGSRTACRVLLTDELEWADSAEGQTVPTGKSSSVAQAPVEGNDGAGADIGDALE